VLDKKKNNNIEIGINWNHGELITNLEGKTNDENKIIEIDDNSGINLPRKKKKI